MKKLEKILIILLIFGLSACSEMGGDGNTIATKDLTTEEDSVSYAIGVNFGTSMKAQKMDNLDVAIVAKAMQDCFDEAELKLGEEQSNELLNAYFQNLQTKIREENMVKSREFLEANKTKEGVQVTATGLQYIVLTEGTGPKPTAEDMVSTHYHGTLMDGTVFDSSVDRGEPVSFEVGKVIPGWTEALQLMPVGSKYKLFVPPFLAYGERGSPPSIGPQELLIFEVELLEIVKQ